MYENNHVSRFEKRFAEWLGVSSAFAFWKGRVAMYAILRAMGLDEGDDVILPGYTCVMDVNPVVYLGARPRYADIEPDTFNVLPERIERAITPRTKVIVAQHTYGYPCEMDGVMDIAEKHGIPVIEDCCLSVGSTYKGKRCGTFGVASYWSFQWNKPFTTGVGGMATTDDNELADKIETLCREKLQQPNFKSTTMLSIQRLVYQAVVYPRTTAFITSLFRWLTKKGLVVGSSSTAEFSPEMPEGFFTGMSAAQASQGVRQMSRIQDIVEHRRRMVRLYERLLRRSGIPAPQAPQYMDPVLVRYPVRVADKWKVVELAHRNQIELGTWFESPLHPIETPLEKYGYEAGMCPEAEKACRQVVNLPTHPRVNQNTARRTVEFISRMKRS